MLFQPTNITPSLLGELGNGCVDIESSAGLTITWQVNGNSPMTAIKIDLADATTSPSTTYSTGVVTLATPFSPVDASGNQQFYSYTIPRSAITSFTNGNTYFLRIRQYWSSTLYVDQMSASQFVTRTAPALSIGTITANSPSITITGTYSQAQGDVLNWARWKLAHITEKHSVGNTHGTTPGISNVVVDAGTFFDAVDGVKGNYRVYIIFPGSDSWIVTRGRTTVGIYSLEDLGIEATGTPEAYDSIYITIYEKTLVDTGNMYGATTLALAYDGLVNGEKYSVELSIETVNGVRETESVYSFAASYNITTVSGGSASYQKDKSGILVNFRSVQASADKYILFREAAATNEYEKVVEYGSDDDQNTMYLLDCGVANSEQVRYVFFQITASPLSVKVSRTNYIKMKSWAWEVIACDMQDDGYYHPQAIYRFVNNVSSGSIGNNSGNNLLTNFTQYPTVQYSPANYMSGTLSGLIGAVTNGIYADTVELKDEIYKLSNGYETVFLKSRKGDIWKIAITGQIVMTTADVTTQQAQTVQIPWTEIGSTDGESIILEQSDDLWGV